MAGQGLAVFFAALAMAEGQAFLRTGDSDVKETALFVQGAFDFGA